MEKPRRFNHQYIYVDERKEKLQKLEEKAKRELGMLPPKEFSPEDIRGKFVQGTKHLKRRKESGRKPMTYGALFVAILVLLYILHYLATGKITDSSLLIYGDAFVALPLCLFALPLWFGLGDEALAAGDFVCVLGRGADAGGDCFSDADGEDVGGAEKTQ